MYFFSLENIVVSLLFYLLALIGFWGSLVFYNSYLPDIAPKEQQDRISAKGFSLGYIGSVILLLICLAMVLLVDESKAIQMMRYSFVLVGIWWIGFSQYTYYYLPNNRNDKKLHFNIIFNTIYFMKQLTPFIDRILSFTISKKLTVFILATIFFKLKMIDSNQWIGLAFMYLGVQGSLDLYKLIMSNKK